MIKKLLNWFKPKKITAIYNKDFGHTWKPIDCGWYSSKGDLYEVLFDTESLTYDNETISVWVLHKYKYYDYIFVTKYIFYINDNTYETKAEYFQTRYKSTSNNTDIGKKFELIPGSALYRTRKEILSYIKEKEHEDESE